MNFGRSTRAATRRELLAGLAAACVGAPAHADPAASCQTDGPVFNASGPDAERYGAADGYPVQDPALLGHPGEPTDVKYRVGLYSHFDEAYPVHRVGHSAAPWCFAYDHAAINYRYKGHSYSLEDYLNRRPVTGLLVAKDRTVLAEHYQYGRTDRDRLFSGSMAKTITGLLVGIAIQDGVIQSVDDPAGRYVAGFAGTEYGRTPIRDLLHMSSGVLFGEDADNDRDLDRLWIDMVLGYGSTPLGTIRSITQFNTRIAAPGTRFAYASIEPDVLGVVLRAATGQSLSAYLQDKLWQHIGTQADAVWLVGADGYEVAHTFFGATLRDYARLGRLLAHDGGWDGEQLIPADWMMQATTARPGDSFLAPGRNGPGSFGYGYLCWLLPGPRRQFALIGSGGQVICIDPQSKLVMVQTAVGSSDEVWRVWSGVVGAFS